MREKIYFENIEIGDTLESIPRTIVETDIWLFAYLTADFFPLHTDIEFSKKTFFGERIAQGMLVLSIALGMVDQVILSRYDVSSVIAFYGLKDVKFLRPVKIGDTIKASSEVVAKEEKDGNSGVVTYRLTVKNQREEVVLMADYSVLIQKSPSKPPL
jgi:acyl dehydratase